MQPCSCSKKYVCRGKDKIRASPEDLFETRVLRVSRNCLTLKIISSIIYAYWVNLWLTVPLELEENCLAERLLNIDIILLPERCGK